MRSSRRISNLLQKTWREYFTAKDPNVRIVFPKGELYCGMNVESIEEVNCSPIPPKAKKVTVEDVQKHSDGAVVGSNIGKSVTTKRRVAKQFGSTRIVLDASRVGPAIDVAATLEKVKSEEVSQRAKKEGDFIIETIPEEAIKGSLDLKGKFTPNENYVPTPPVIPAVEKGLPFGFDEDDQDYEEIGPKRFGR